MVLEIWRATDKFFYFLCQIDFQFSVTWKKIQCMMD